MQKGIAIEFLHIDRLVDPMLTPPDLLHGFISLVLRANKTFYMLSREYGCTISYDADNMKFELVAPCDAENAESIESTCQNLKDVKARLMSLCSYTRSVMYDIVLQLNAPFEGHSSVPILDSRFKSGRHLMATGDKTKNKEETGMIPFPCCERGNEHGNEHDNEYSNDYGFGNEYSNEYEYCNDHILIVSNTYDDKIHDNVLEM